MPTSSMKSRSMEKERGWWSADLKGEMEKLEVEGSFSVNEGGPLVSSDGAYERRT